MKTHLLKKRSLMKVFTYSNNPVHMVKTNYFQSIKKGKTSHKLFLCDVMRMKMLNLRDFISIFTYVFGVNRKKIKINPNSPLHQTPSSSAVSAPKDLVCPPQAVKRMTCLRCSEVRSLRHNCLSCCHAT